MVFSIDSTKGGPPLLYRREIEKSPQEKSAPESAILVAGFLLLVVGGEQSTRLIPVPDPVA